MWKIERLYLQNFVCIQAGMHRSDVTLDFTDCNKKVNIFIGKMGSGKTSILGHLQPYADYGTLDVKNKLDEIIAGKDGLKEIRFIHDSDVYDIRHVFSWNRSTLSHATKSFISLNGEELNANGNVSSFKELIKIHFGIDQNFLRLLRLGPNVANVINMKSTERKGFIATLLEDTEIYMSLYKKLGEDLRNMNSTLTVLNNKLMGLSSEKENEMKAEVEELEEDIEGLSKEVEQYRDSISKLKGVNQALIKGTRGDILGALGKLEAEFNEKSERYDQVVEALDTMPTEGIEALSEEFAEAREKFNRCEEQILHIQMDLEPNRTERNKLTDEILLHDNTAQIEELESQAAAISKTFERTKYQIENFDHTYNYTFLVNFLTSLQSFQLSLEEMCSNPEEVIRKCFFSDKSLINWAQKRINICTAKQVNLQKLLRNIDFAADYRCPIPLYVPPGCPTEDCPYRTSHPITIGETNTTLSSIDEIKSQISSLDKEIAVYGEYGVQWPKMRFLKENWKIISTVLAKIGVLIDDNLLNLLMNLDIRNRWYDQGALMRYIENTKAYEDFDGMKQRAKEINEELERLRSLDIAGKKLRLEQLEIEYEDMLKTLEELRAGRDELMKNKERLSRIMSNLGNREALQMEKVRLSTELETMKTNIFELKTRASQYEDNSREILILETQMHSCVRQYETKVEKCTKLKHQLQDIRSTADTYQEYLEEVRILKLIMSAVSAKDGIPLVMVKVFLDDCKEIINELISDIFEDDLEIIEFAISEDSNDFKIPYRINGQDVPDIEFASQGQQAVISIALSFALCRKATFDYNIMLLDEIDNSIHKSDRERFIMILSKQMMALGTEQVFLITHNDIFQQSGLPVNIIMTTPEIVDPYENQSIMRLY